MASTNPSSIISDHLYSLDDKLERGRPPPLLKNACEDVAVGEEAVPETASVIDPVSISRCCIKKGLFPATPHVLGTSDAGVDNALLLPAVLPPTPPLFGTSDIAACMPCTFQQCCLLLIFFSEHST
ncbi:hypothetical protein ACE6H2_011121 [Prunus campanulata]